MGFHSRGKTSPFGTSFVNMPSNPQNVRVDFESIRRNGRSNLQKEVFIAGAKLHLLEPVVVNMPSNFFQISESISNGFTDMFGQTFIKRSL